MFELLKRYDQREFALILLLVGTVALAPVSTYLVWPAYKSVKTLTTSRDTLFAAANTGGELSGKILELRDEVRSLEQRLHGDLAGLPAKEVEAYVVGRLQAISWRNRVDLVGVEPGDGDDIETFREVQFRVRLNGDYFDLYSWLRDLGRELGFIVIKQYEMSPINQGEQNPRLEAVLTIAAYRTMSS